MSTAETQQTIVMMPKQMQRLFFYKTLFMAYDMGHRCNQYMLYLQFAVPCHMSIAIMRTV